MLADSILLTAFVASLIAGLATAVGALPILAIGRPTDQQQNLMLGFAAGVMLAASFFSLILPGIEHAQELGASRAAASATIVAAILLGGFCLAQINAIIPPLDRIGVGPDGIADARVRRVWIFIAAITLHNLPEGLAVGVSFGSGDLSAGITTALGIGLQNIPEGLAVAGALASLGYSARASIGAALASGLVEPVGGLLGAGIISIAQPLLPWGLGFAAGAMIWVVVSDIIPDAHNRVGGSRATAGLMIGLGGMLFLDTAFG